MIEDNGERRLIDKEVIVDLDETHNQFKYRAGKLFNILVRGYSLLCLIWVLLTWKMYEITKYIKQIDGLIDNSSIELNSHPINSNLNIDINNNNINLVTIFWWSFQVITLILMIYLLLKYRKVVKQLNSNLFTILACILAIGTLSILRDLLSINIIQSVSSQLSSLINTIQYISPQWIQSASIEWQLFYSINKQYIKQYESDSNFMYVMNIVSLAINPLLLVLMFYLYCKLYYSQRKCLSLIDTLKTNNVFDIQSTISHQQISPQIQQISPQKQLKYIQSQSKLLTNSSKELKQKQNKSQQINQIQMVNFTTKFQTNKENPKINTIHHNTQNVIHHNLLNIRHQQLQPSCTQQSNNSIGQLHQIPQLTQYSQPHNKQTKTQQNIFYSTQQYPHLVSKSFSNISNSQNNKQYHYPTQLNM